eukprot:snap_masked-scaffold_2-processed-gene-25.43-mRNA-1 protein AED:1.00 eAED:1.00 QI:0/0/0/0/1/1/2/0/60
MSMRRAFQKMLFLNFIHGKSDFEAYMCFFRIKNESICSQLSKNLLERSFASKLEDGDFFF